MSLHVAKVIDIMVLCNNNNRSTINQHNNTNYTKGRKEGGDDEMVSCHPHHHLPIKLFGPPKLQESLAHLGVQKLQRKFEIKGSMLVGFFSTLPWGLGPLEGNLNANNVPLPLEEMTWDHPSHAHVALSTCHSPLMWITLDQL